MAFTVAEITAQIYRLEVNANDARFDAQMRSMFRKSARALKKELAV